MIKISPRHSYLPMVVITIVLVVLTHYYIALFTPPGYGKTPITVEFPSGVSFYQIGKTLEEKGIIRDWEGFALLAKLRGATKKIKAGEYEFNTSMTPLKVLEKLEKGWVIKHPLTIPEGHNIREIADLLGKRGLTTKERFLAKASDKVFLSSIGIEASTSEGYLFPDTYQFFKGMPEEAMIKAMASRFREVFTKELEMRAKDMGISVKDAIILASIVEKETGRDRERPIIARVFINRIKQGIPLQSDPTVIYGIKDFNGNLTKKDLLTETPYNTYRKRGLPPSPISNPGLDSIRAVLYPADSDYIYFVSKNDGTHHFSKTLGEHNRAVHRYQVAAHRAGK